MTGLAPQVSKGRDSDLLHTDVWVLDASSSSLPVPELGVLAEIPQLLGSPLSPLLPGPTVSRGLEEVILLELSGCPSDCS